MKVIVLALSLTAFLSIQGLAQSKEMRSDLMVRDANYQSCLDEGEDMLACSRSYYIQVDSILISAHEHLRNKLKPAEQSRLAKEHQEWLKLRDRQFEKIDKDNLMEGRNYEMFRYHEKAAVLKKRALTLMSRF